MSTNNMFSLRNKKNIRIIPLKKKTPNLELYIYNATWQQKGYLFHQRHLHCLIYCQVDLKITCDIKEVDKLHEGHDKPSNIYKLPINQCLEKPTLQIKHNFSRIIIAPS